MTKASVLLFVRPFVAGISGFSGLVFASLLGAMPGAAEITCKAWNTTEFFEKASAADVSRCLTAGADVHAIDSYSRPPLHNAAEESKTPAVIIPVLLKAGADVNARIVVRGRFANDEGKTPLHFAARNDFHAAAAIEALVKAGANVNTGLDMRSCHDGSAYGCECGITPLHFAADNYHAAAAIEALVKAGANVNARTHCEKTPLHNAADGSSEKAISALVAAGANLDARDLGGRTPLHVAADGVSEEMISALIAVGADPDARDKKGNTPLDIARAGEKAWAEATAKEKSSIKLRVLESKRAIVAALSADAIATVREKARQAAAAARKRKVEQRLRAARVSCTKWSTSGFFKHAAEKDVSRCLENKDLHARNQYGETPLHMAAKFSKAPAVIATLRKAGADLKARDEKGRTPLHTAAVFSEEPEVVTALIVAGADLNAQDKRGRTPLQFAEKFSQTPAVVAILKKAGTLKETAAARKPQVEQRPRMGRVSCEKWNTPAFFGSAGAADLSRCLKTKKPDERNQYGRTPLHYAAQGDAPGLVTALVEAGAKVNARDERGGWTPLHLAAQSGKTPAVVAALFAAGADINARDKRGRTPLEIAENFNKTPAVMAALKTALAKAGESSRPAVEVPCEKWNTPAFFKNAGLEDLSRCLKTKDPNARNKNGRTPLHYAAQGQAARLVTALVNAGAKVGARDERGGWTPLHLAAWFSKTPAVVAALLSAGADPAARDKAGKTPWDYAEQNAALKDTAPYWRLQEERFR